MNPITTVFSAQKDGQEPKDYEDAWMRRGKKFAFSDGATEGYRAKEFAQILVRTFVESPIFTQEVADWLEWLRKPIAEWIRGIDWANLPWFAQAKAERGSMATLLGLAFADWTWQAVAVGDICMFHIRNLAVVQTFPLTDPKEFGFTPALVLTKLDRDQESLRSLKMTQGDCEAGDMFLVLTDAMAAWLMTIIANGDVAETESVLRFLSRLTQRQFIALVQELRANGGMKNDDVTFARIFTV